MSKLVDRVRTYKVANDVTDHVEQHKTLYSSLATGVGFAIITYVIMRARPQLGNFVIGDTTNGAIVCIIGEKAVLSNVSFVSPQGVPSA